MHMKKAFGAFVVSLMLLAISVLGCNHSVDSMVNDYNEQFSTGYASVSDSYSPTTVLKPDDEGWDESMLL